jgi:hypothetical protein
MMHQRRGQAAMEFLMTYGWAILAAVIVIGVLAYFGVFSPSTYVPNVCQVSAPFGVTCAATTAGVDIELRNWAGETLNVTSIAVVGCNTTAPYGTIAADAAPKVSLLCALTGGTKFKGDITVKYTRTGSTLEQIASGQIVQKVG